MELSELRQMTGADLRVKEREAREEVFRLRLKLRTNQLDNHAGYRRARRELALIMTLLGEKARSEARNREEGRVMRERIKRREGTVVSAKMTKTVVVKVDRMVEHAIYGKRVRRSTRFMAHDERGECREGDRVLIIESRALSKNKRWRVSRVLKKAAG